MNIREYILEMFVALLIFDLIIFFFLLIRKIMIIRYEKYKATLWFEYEQKVLMYITTGKNEVNLEDMKKKDEKIFKEVVFSYIKELRNEEKDLLINLVGRDKITESVKENLASKSIWKNAVGAYEAGEYNITEAAEQLTDLLNSKYTEIVFIAADSLLNIKGSMYLKNILDRCSDDPIMSKRNLMSVIEVVEDDIEDLLLSYMESDSFFIQTVVLEVAAIKQYKGIVKYIMDGFISEDKEIQISSLKAALEYENFPYEECLMDFLQLMKDEDWEVRLFFAKNLHKVNNPRVINVLAGLMKDRNWLVRNNAANILVDKGPSGISMLIEVIESDDLFAADKAKEVLIREVLQNSLIEKLEAEDFNLSQLVYLKIEKILVEENNDDDNS